MTLPRLKSCPFCGRYPITNTRFEEGVVRCVFAFCCANPRVVAESLTKAAERWNLRKPRYNPKKKAKKAKKPT